MNYKGVVIFVKRLIKKASDQEELKEQGVEDPYLGQYVEITNHKSKYYGYKAWVSKNYASGERYKLYIIPEEWEHTDKKYHINFIRRWDARRWLSIVGYDEESANKDVKKD
jgi:hypothetical protein